MDCHTVRQRTRCDSAAVAGHALDALRPRIEEAGARIEAHGLPELVAEPVLLRQLFQNLVGNALKFTDGAPPQIRMAASREGASGHAAWRFTVADNGVGIPPEHAERVFSVFKRLHGREVPGTGIGLAICRRIVERHGGEIGVQPREGGGSVFAFTIPEREAGSALS